MLGKVLLGLILILQTTGRDLASLDCENCAKDVIVYSCDFDTVTCEGLPPFFTNTTQFFYGLYTSISLNPLPLSDYTSISKPANNRLQCQIPYLLNSQQYYHCQNTPDFDCRTTNTEMSKCALGRFLLFNPTIYAAGFLREFSFVRVSTVPNVIYEISFYLFYYTSNAAYTPFERMKFTINGLENGYLAQDLLKSPTWSRKSILYNARNNYLDMRVSFIRDTTTNRFESFFAIDEIQVKRIDSSTNTTTTSTRITTTATTTKSNSQSIRSNSFYLLTFLSMFFNYAIIMFFGLN